MATLDQRRSGIVLHPTSLPGPHGSGDFGPAAYHFIDWLAAAGQSVWQILPLTPIGPGNSPYASVSAFAGNPLLVALEPLVEKKWMAPIAASEIASFNPQRVDFSDAMNWRMGQLRAAAHAFFDAASASDRAAFADYCGAQSSWLDDFALFMALDTSQRARGVDSWPQWDPQLARRNAQALTAARREHGAEVDFWRFTQWCFETQWSALMRYAHERGVRIVGDLPIFIAHHSADCWARPDLYLLDQKFAPTVIAGVPPDFFSPTGQRWGNPLYDWAAMKRDGFAWWIARARRQLALADLVRIDHFRGFAGYWEIPSSCPTAMEGRWVDAPGMALFEAMRAALGDLPVIAEDLGVITPDVEQLRDAFAFPGMRILQFGFNSDASHAFLPHNYVANCVVYTGTHDNDTARGWFDSATERERDYACAYLDGDAHNVHWAMLRGVLGSVAKLAMAQFQDVLGLDSRHRMNIPGQIDCWTWRFTWDMVGPQPAARLAALSAAYGRAPMDKLNLAAWPADRTRP